ncbi:phage tail sheath C-terminal domain-containing protein [Aliiglaciecola sp. CAU 1673]|uniref:phage tail sheath family protein n=1 Tax=Aliiglaciecola sp. CAU 1673 TaxID=3032595 RepID=UPI0023D9A91A|nr:phage tail sheath C-terminal domain-containing protein [Aliiglaciecola sp. CAU 1673]MDF2177195.1 phage tail sheath C-terminal domain-containing protein [Aliiglaciecola sp. CAU 1673]
MGQMKTPGVYIVEKNAFPNSIVEVATAVPAFIGYTQFAQNGKKSLHNTPMRITSMAEFHKFFGFAATSQFSLAEAEKDPKGVQFQGKDKRYQLQQDAGKFQLYRAMMLFYQNGGGPCYVVSVGSYLGDDGKENAVAPDKLTAGVDTLLKEQEPTMVLVPDAILLGEADCISVQQAVLAHCGGKMRNRVAILDIYDGYKDRQDESGDCIENFRSKLGINYLDFASAYYPWVNTTIVLDRDLSFENISSLAILQEVIRQERGIADAEVAIADDAPAAKKAELLKLNQQIKLVNGLSTDWSTVKADPVDGESEDENKARTKSKVEAEKLQLHKALKALSPAYVEVLAHIRQQLNLLPPAAAMAGIYTMVDNSLGVWKAPANVSLSAVVSPAVNISHDEQEDLNVTTSGKSINAIRTYIGEGTLVWGARTLDGNSLDWRYINVRRTMIMLEESIRLATKAYVFENNTANTWATIKSMIRNFLTGIWKRGGLAGASPEDAFSVSVGLGETMTGEDILEGILRVTVLVALIRPAEFIEITFQQQMQKS